MIGTNKLQKNFPFKSHEVKGKGVRSSGWRKHPNQEIRSPIRVTGLRANFPVALSLAIFHF